MTKPAASDTPMGAPVADRTRTLLNNDEAMALIEFVRNHAADLCQNIAVTHFTDRLAWEQQEVDPLEIAESTGADHGATECRNDVKNMDCHALWLDFKARK